MNAADIKNETRAALAAVLQEQVGQGKAADALAECAGVSVSQMYRYLGASSDASFGAVTALVRRCGNDELRLAIAQIFLAATGLKVIAEGEAGAPSARAVILNAFVALEAVTKFTREADSAVADGRVTQREVVQLRQRRDELVQALDASVTGAELLSQRPAPRLAV